ncbi:HlyD family secretion protein [Flavobacterium nitrogenifigens]|uniref:Multidrug resistance efflux pump n=1 Tax=Flavobacterium nitrogenifigens TaxID=1617283 RepID=A0A521DRN2_9FLAO|nr:biotin/lipoyl-binding protein [Flavobacterium nitrogenifigens]KAF2339685.1 HlyD family efflux transporter periplasmic adaptor subunit [Flavobacterium nitrogenifigens]SMO73540.1 Multidrug resistance efflux pump [Flavobacterium nitrogenifigens]
MLNLSKDNNVLITPGKYKSITSVARRPHYEILNKVIIGFLLFGVACLFLPWTQNISGTGSVTTLKPDQRPQTVHNAIAGRIEKWFVKEGDYVKKGDTILYISEIKEDYLDPNLVDNTKQQVDAKKMAAESYGDKVNSLDVQAQSLNTERQLKLQQAQNKIRQSQLKIKSDSMDLVAVKTQLRIAKTQFDRSTALNKEGLKPMTDVEQKRLKLQESEAYVITQENKLLSSKNELINAKVEINRITAEYAEKISKSRSDKFTALSTQYDTEAQVNKLENQYTNYRLRNGLYYITAPQSGYVNRALLAGLGETIKEGTPVVSIMPSKYDIAVETYVDPIDLPLVHKGAKVRVWFDGWPRIVFSGWPGLSYGTYGGKVVAIENFISPNGKYRILVSPDGQDRHWPKELSIGAGAQSIALLETVSVWYEIWRNLNGFPPNYYNSGEKEEKGKEKK